MKNSKTLEAVHTHTHTHTHTGNLINKIIKHRRKLCILSEQKIT